MSMLTQNGIQVALGREIPEEVLVIAKLAVGGMDAESIAGILGSTREEVEQLLESQDYKDVRLLVGVEHARIKTGTDFSWDGIENAALENLAPRVATIRDPDQLLKIAAVANRAQRRLSPKTEHVLDPANAQTRVPLKLTKRFTEKLNGDGQVIERSETQQISVVNGTAKTPSFQTINEIFAIRRDASAASEEPNSTPIHGASPVAKALHMLMSPSRDASRDPREDELDAFMNQIPEE